MCRFHGILHIRRSGRTLTQLMQRTYMYVYWMVCFETLLMIPRKCSKTSPVCTYTHSRGSFGKVWAGRQKFPPWKILAPFPLAVSTCTCIYIVCPSITNCPPIFSVQLFLPSLEISFSPPLLSLPPPPPPPLLVACVVVWVCVHIHYVHVFGPQQFLFMQSVMFDYTPKSKLCIHSTSTDY